MSDFMDRHASDILESEELLHLSADALIKLISRNSFCASEMVIFRAVSAWCEFNNITGPEAEPSKRTEIFLVRPKLHIQ